MLSFRLEAMTKTYSKLQDRSSDPLDVKARWIIAKIQNTKLLTLKWIDDYDDVRLNTINIILTTTGINVLDVENMFKIKEEMTLMFTTEILLPRLWVVLGSVLDEEHVELAKEVANKRLDSYTPDSPEGVLWLCNKIFFDIKNTWGEKYGQE